VLRELQLVADSPDALKRNRGRRGLDMLQRIQKISNVQTQIIEDDFPHLREVDQKLIELAKRYEGKLVTNDFNLNKLAQLQGIDVLNINELANALRPIVLPGEAMRVFILKEGKEQNQGVAYLDDGTMVVVENARRVIGRTIDISVTSVLQTTAGKMIFGRYEEGRGAPEAIILAARAGRAAGRADRGAIRPSATARITDRIPNARTIPFFLPCLHSASSPSFPPPGSACAWPAGVQPRGRSRPSNCWSSRAYPCSSGLSAAWPPANAWNS
jgi:hypothetical protein